MVQTKRMNVSKIIQEQGHTANTYVKCQMKLKYIWNS